ncbi:protein of hypothetical function DUF896 [Neisseria shayeganii 871]|uniref:Protein of hypothetical function DUF896 n=2 Tax=Neisseria shayeganii TaxID=607712 RepID=G4CIB9_9NEIS|nr:protein of hypothetical function DUF896 [Neisseria shayeganii 871]
MLISLYCVQYAQENKKPSKNSGSFIAVCKPAQTASKRQADWNKECIMRIMELDRINELARKAKTEGLNAAELAEQVALRQAYIRQVCGQLNNMLSTVTVVDPEGQDVTPAKLRAAQATGMQTTV